MAKVGIIVQARMGSTRLPGKVLKNLNGQPMLWHIIQRLKKVQNADEIVVATSDKEIDKPIAELAEESGVKYFAGSEDDVLDRFIKAAKMFEIDVIVRITADCPLADPDIIDQLIEKHFTEQNDYTSNVIERTFPRGLDAEAVNLAALEKVAAATSEARFHEHVTLFIYQHPELFRIGNLKAREPYNRPELRLTVDTEEDFKLVEYIYRDLCMINQYISMPDVFQYLDNNPHLLKLNANIEQKTV